MMTKADDQNLVAHVRRLASDGVILYVRIAQADVASLDLKHGQRVEIDMGGKVCVRGIVKTSGGSPWLAPGQSSSNAAITSALRNAGLKHGDDIQAVIRCLEPTESTVVGASATVGTAPATAPPIIRPGGLQLDRQDPIHAVEQTRAMAEFHLRFSAADIPRWAGNYKDSDDTPTRLGKTAKARGFMTREEFLAIGDWKSPRPRRHRERNEDEFVREVTGVALGTTGERLRIEVLTLLDGVDWSTASVLLHFAHHERYPILDFRALWSLSIEQVPSPCDFEFWSEYTRFCRDLSDHAGVDMRTLDRALWEYSKENQPAE